MTMAEHDADILNALQAEGMASVAVVGSSTFKGVLYRRYREIESGVNTLVGLHLSFDCRFSDVPEELTRGGEIVIDGVRYRFERFLPEGGDESGWVHCELGVFK